MIYTTRFKIYVANFPRFFKINTNILQYYCIIDWNELFILLNDNIIYYEVLQIH